MSWIMLMLIIPKAHHLIKNSDEWRKFQANEESECALMSQLKYCQGPKCHTYDTKDRKKGPKDNKRNETRRRSSFYYLDGNACAQCNANAIGLMYLWSTSLATLWYDHSA